jgi:hypothetical protein
LTFCFPFYSRKEHPPSLPHLPILKVPNKMRFPTALQCCIILLTQHFTAQYKNCASMARRVDSDSSTDEEVIESELDYDSSTDEEVIESGPDSDSSTDEEVIESEPDCDSSSDEEVTEGGSISDFENASMN